MFFSSQNECEYDGFQKRARPRSYRLDSTIHVERRLHIGDEISLFRGNRAPSVPEQYEAARLQKAGDQWRPRRLWFSHFTNFWITRHSRVALRCNPARFFLAEQDRQKHAQTECEKPERWRGGTDGGDAAQLERCGSRIQQE